MDHIELLDVDDLSAEIDWDTFFTFEPEDLNLLAADAGVTPSPDSGTPSLIDEIENILMNDDDQEADAGAGANPEFCSQAWADVLADSPGAISGEVVDCSSEKDSESSGQEKGGREEKKDSPAEVANDSDSADDPISKKRQRQLRNRDAAVRSRERKKSYVKDLEIKSKYLEGECLRMGRMLQCLIAENQALRLCMQNKAYGASMSKQESAVLLMESLLLGSLLWFLSIMCLPMPLNLVAQNAAEKDREGRAQKGARNEIFRSFGSSCSFTMTRRCKASKTKMRGSSLVRAVIAV